MAIDFTVDKFVLYFEHDLCKKNIKLIQNLVQEGYVKSGYNTVHIDDCWMESQRDLNGRLVADRKRFPSGIAALANFVCFSNVCMFTLSLS